MMLLDIDPNVVQPGWTPLIITIFLAAVMVLLFFSMRRHFRKMNESDVFGPRPAAPTPGGPGRAQPRVTSGTATLPREQDVVITRAPQD